MDGLPFIDTNVFLRHVMGDNADHSPRAARLFERIDDGELVACTIETAIFEAVYVMVSVYRVPREEIREAMVSLLRMPGLRVPGKSALVDAFDLFAEHRPLSYGDCYHAIVARRLGSPEFISFDRDFSRLPWLNRTEPS
jgi:predicted nucleic acid-binding protein